MYSFDLKLLILSNKFSFSILNVQNLLNQIKTVSMRSLTIKGLSSFQTSANIRFSSKTNLYNWIVNDFLKNFILDSGYLIIPISSPKENQYKVLTSSSCYYTLNDQNPFNLSCISEQTSMITDMEKYIKECKLI